MLQETNTQGKKHQKPIIEGYIYEIPVRIIIDSGSEISIMSQEFYDRLTKIHRLLTLPVSGVNIMGITGIKSQPIRIETQVPIKLNNVTIMTTLLVVPKININVLLGTDWLYRFKTKLDFKNTDHWSGQGYCVLFTIHQR